MGVTTVLAAQAEPAERRDAAITVRDLSFTYPNGGVLALDGLGLDVPRGRTVGIVGPSGCGKSTLLSLIASLLRPTKGELSVRAFDRSRQTLTMMFQKDTLLPWLTAEENMKLYFRIHGGGRRPGVAELVEELLSLAHLEAFRRFFPYQLSGGMRRRVVFLSTVLPRPEILLLDEPFSSLDEPTRVSIHQDVLPIIRRLNMTVVLVTHDLAEAVSLCDEVVVLSARPGHVVSRQSVPFGAERDMLALRQTPEFLAIYGALWRELSEQIAISRRLGDDLAPNPR